LLIVDLSALATESELIFPEVTLRFIIDLSANPCLLAINNQNSTISDA
jgi:hypothetical protein